jgi:hypothetical protein
MLDKIYMPNEALDLGDRLKPPTRDPYLVFYDFDLKTGEPYSKGAAKRGKDAWRAAHRLVGFKIVHERI